MRKGKNQWRRSFYLNGGLLQRSASIGDAVIATDMEGKITFLNPVAEKLTGWSFSEALLKPVAEVFHITNEGTGEKVACPITKVLETGMKVELTNHTILIRKDETEVFIDDSAAPIKDKEGNIYRCSACLSRYKRT